MSLATAGLSALWGAIAACLITVAVGIRPLRSRSAEESPLAARAMLLATILAALSCVLLALALITGDFSIDYVVRTTSLSTPWAYRLAALWGAMEGSLLFYSTLSLGFGALATNRIPAAFRPVARLVVVAVGGSLLLLTALMANPWVTLDIPAVDGEGLVAILQHPAMVYHPPILYLGLTSLLVPFAITAAAIWRRRLDGVWIAVTRRWTLISWTLLTFGMVAGANWAYVELGWGGFWAWDPVENTSLMPWLAATVFLHTSRVQLRDGRFTRWNTWFAMFPFLLTVLGVYLTRSGVTGSIHAFAESDKIGRVLLSLFLALVVVVLWRILKAPRGAAWSEFAISPRGTWLAGEGGLLAAILAFVLIGSAYPAYLGVFSDSRSSVDPTFFVSMVLPPTFLIVVGTAIALRTTWAGDGSVILSGMKAFLAFSVSGLLVAGLMLGWSATWGFLLLGLSVGGVALLVWDLGTRRPRGRILAAHLAHLGILVVLVGAAGSSLGAEFRGGMGPGDVVEVGGYEVRLDGVRTGEAGRFIFAAADLTLLKDGATVDNVSPQIRAYESQSLPVPEPALRSTPREDIVFAISRVNQDASGVEVNVFVRPLVFWVWAGALLIGVAGLVGLSSRAGGDGERHRGAKAGQPTREATTSN